MDNEIMSYDSAKKHYPPGSGEHVPEIYCHWILSEADPGQRDVSSGRIQGYLGVCSGYLWYKQVYLQQVDGHER